MIDKRLEWRLDPNTIEFFRLITVLKQAEVDILVSGGTLATKEGAKNSTAYQIGLIQGLEAVLAIEFESEGEEEHE